MTLSHLPQDDGFFHPDDNGGNRPKSRALVLIQGDQWRPLEQAGCDVDDWTSNVGTALDEHEHECWHQEGELAAQWKEEWDTWADRRKCVHCGKARSEHRLLSTFNEYNWLC